MNSFNSINRRRIYCATSMDVPDLQELQKNYETEVHDAKGVEVRPTPPTAMEEAIAAQSVSEKKELDNRLDNVLEHIDQSLLRLGTPSRKKSSGSGSQQLCPKHDWSTELTGRLKKRKTRRGKPKYKKLPYSKQQSFPPRTRSRSDNRLMKTSTQPPAPYNTTQFLIADHNDLPDFKEKLAAEVAAKSEMPRGFQKPLAPPRTRDSSFSIDSDEDYFYSSPEDEKEFLTKEFSSAYEDLQAERLNSLSKYELIQEYIQLEAKLELLSKRLRSKNAQQTDEERELDEKNSPTVSNIDGDMAKKLKIFQQKIDDLQQQTEQLRRDNEALRGKEMRSPSPESSIDSESDSASSNRTGCSCSGASDSPMYQSEVSGRLSTASSSSDVINKDNLSISTSASSGETTNNCSNGNSTREKLA